MEQNEKPQRKNRKTERLLRHFQNKPNVRVEIVKQAAAKGASASPELTPEEQVAITALWCARLPIDQAIQRASTGDLERTTSKLGEAFFTALEQTAAGLAREGLDQEAANLLKVGEVLAQERLEHAWAQKFRQQSLSKLEGRLRDLEFLKQKGW